MTKQQQKSSANKYFGFALHRHYGWVICFACLLLHACCCGLAVSIISIYAPYLKDALELTNTQTSLISTMRALSSMVFILTAAKFYRKFSLRTGACIACLILSASCVLMAFAPNFIFCYIAAAGFGLSYAYGTMVPIALFMRNWFVDRRATAIAIAACGSGVTSTVVPPIFTAILEKSGLTTAFLLECGLSVLIAAVLFLILRSTPEEKGLKPYQDIVPASKKEIAAHHRKRELKKGLTKKETLMFLAAVFLIGSIGPPWLAHLTIHFHFIGFTPAVAALAFSIVGVLMVIAKFLFGIASDRYGTFPVNFVYIGCLMASSLIAAALQGGSFLIYPAAILGGIGISLVTIGITVWSTDLANDEDYAKMVESSQSANAVGALAFSFVPGILADISGGSYRSSYIMFLVMALVVMLLIQRVYRKHLI